jgi:hypothetical protein
MFHGFDTLGPYLREKPIIDPYAYRSTFDTCFHHQQRGSSLSLRSLRENRRLPCVIMFAMCFISGRTAKPFFAVRHSFSARQTFTHGNYTLCRAFSKRRTAKENLCRAFFRDARQSVFADATTPGPSLLLTDVNLCRASSQNARQRRIVCRAFYVCARQSFFKNVFSYLLLIFPPLIHYFVVYTSIM